MSTRKPVKLHSGMAGNGGAHGTRTGTRRRSRTNLPARGQMAASYSQRIAGNTTRFYREER